MSDRAWFLVLVACAALNGCFALDGSAMAPVSLGVAMLNAFLAGTIAGREIRGARA